MKRPIRVVVVGGPTASGKTSLSIELAKRFNGEIISADSRQVYRYLDIGTAKGKVQKRNSDGTVVIDGIIHHLIDILDPNESFTLYEFLKLATKAIAEIYSKKKLPIIAGGTGLYLDALTKEFSMVKQNIDKSIRKNLSTKTVTDLQNIARNLDHTSFEKLSGSDQKNPHRIIRFIEKNTSCNIDENSTRRPSNYNYCYLGILADKDIVLKSIDTRVNMMMKDGLLDENRKLRKKGYTTELFAMKSIGYQEFDCYFSDECTLEYTVDLIKLHTRQYYKRQMTWFKKNKEILWINDIPKAIMQVERFLKI
jgi:tRNA dimethylallyltransferase